MELNLERAYRSSSHLLGRDFVAQLIASSMRYRRAAAFFSSSVFGVAGAEFVDFVMRGGRIDLICSPLLSKEDGRALALGTFRRQEARAKVKGAPSAALLGTAQLSYSDFLAWLIATDVLEVRIAHLPLGRAHDIYHEKIGIFFDLHGHEVAFTGSANESNAAYVGNFERVDVFASFTTETERRRTASIVQQFDALWKNETTGVEVLSAADALRRRLIRVRPTVQTDTSTVPAFDDALDALVAPESLAPPSNIDVRKHQTAAISEWAKAGGRGVLEMATGSGKTITALVLATKLFDRSKTPLCVLIIAPYIHLVDQWVDVARRFGLSPIRCAEGSSTWYAELGAAIHSLNSGQRPVLSIATTAQTMLSESFQRLLGGIRQPMLVIGDEVHNYGAAKTNAALPRNAALRVGLSATPERAHDIAGTQRLFEYFGDTVYKYTLKDALRDDVLTPYRYFPEVVTFDEDEADEYLKLTKLIVRYGGEEGGGEGLNERVKNLLIQRARVIGSARRKLPLLRSLLHGRRDETHILVYVGDGTVEGPEDNSVARQVDACVSLIGNELQMRCAPYTADTAPDRRRALLDQFSSGELQVLVAIRCLDEGVDVPATRTAYLLASSTNPRQFVQRRGRVLRKFPGKSRATIHDVFVAMSPSEFKPELRDFAAAKNLLKNQLTRSMEFADLAENGPVARERLLELRKHFELLHEG